MGGSSNNNTIAHSPAAAASSATPISAMSTTVNLVMTTFGFLVSAVFIFFVLVRLLCARFQNRRVNSRRIFRNQGIEGRTSGMDPIFITLLPTIKFSGDVFASQEDATCAVCLGEYEDRDFLRILPQCGHTFHANCIDAWLRQHATCPVCRIHLKWLPLRRSLPSPLLSEAARLRFSPGVIPESLFQQPLLASSNPIQDSGATDVGRHEHNVAHDHVIQINAEEESEAVSQNNSISSSQVQGIRDVYEGRPSLEKAIY